MERDQITLQSPLYILEGVHITLQPPLYILESDHIKLQSVIITGDRPPHDQITASIIHTGKRQNHVTTLAIHVHTEEELHHIRVCYTYLRATTTSHYRLLYILESDNITLQPQLYILESNNITFQPLLYILESDPHQSVWSAGLKEVSNRRCLVWRGHQNITLTEDNTTSNNTSHSSKPGATQFSIGSFELVY